MKISQQELQQLIKEEISSFYKKESEQELNEVVLTGVGWLLNSYGWLIWAIRIVKRIPGIPKESIPALDNIQKALEILQDSVNTFSEQHPALSKIFWGSVAVADPIGTGAAKAKEKFAQVLHDKIATSQDETIKEMRNRFIRSNK